MIKEWKKTKVEDLAKKLKAAHGVFLTEFRGLTVSDALTLRRTLWPLEAEYRVVKNTYLHYASQGGPTEKLTPYFQGPTAVLLCFQDPMAALKSLYQFAAGNPALKVKAGMVEGEVMSSQALERLSRLPSRDVLRAQCVGTIASPLRSTVRAISWPMQSFLAALNGITEKRRSTQAS